MLKVFQKKLIEYQKSGQKDKVSVLRYLLASLKNREIELRVDGVDLSKEDVLKIIKKQIKQHKESVEIYKNAGREDLEKKEAGELEILEELLSFAESL
jgi:uncharacterized protein